MDWATNVSLPEVNGTIHDTVTSYIKSCRAVTLATRPVWRELSSLSSTSTKKELPVNEMAMNIIEERAKAAFEKLQQQQPTSSHQTTTIAMKMENIPEEDGDDEDGEIDEGDNTEDAVVAEEDSKDEVNADAADNNEISVMNEDAPNGSHDTTTTNAELKTNPAKSIIPAKKNMISLLRKNKPNQAQMLPPSKRSNTTTANTKPTAPIKKTNITKPINTTVQQHRNNNQTMMNNRGSGGSGRGGNNSSSSGRSGSGGGRGGVGAVRNAGVTGK